MYTLVTMPSARRALKKLPRVVRETLIDELQTICDDPLVVPKLEAPWGFLRSLHVRLQKTDYRVVFEVDTQQREIIIHYADTRENFYRTLRQLKLKSVSRS